MAIVAEAIKTALGTELTAQVEEALKGKGKDGKDLELVVGNDGSYVPALKFNTEKSRADNAENALKSAAEALKNIGGSGDAAKLADDVAEAKKKMEDLQTDHENEIASIRKNAAVRAALAGKVHDPADIIALLDMEKIGIDKEGALKGDLEDHLKPLRESKSYLFLEEQKGTGVDVAGLKPGTTGTGTGNGTGAGGSDMDQWRQEAGL